MEAEKLKQLDRLREYTTQAFIDRAMNATDKNGRYKVKTEKDLFDLDKEVDKIIRGGEPSREIGDLIKIANNLSEYREKRKDMGQDNAESD